MTYKPFNQTNDRSSRVYDWNPAAWNVSAYEYWHDEALREAMRGITRITGVQRRPMNERINCALQLRAQCGGLDDDSLLDIIIAQERANVRRDIEARRGR